jgi:glutamyl-tRNA(Gln) amidotransferase subunit E
VKVGLEVHQQLATTKLFCACPSELSEGIETTFVRRLRPASGEERAVDAAAAFQASRGFAYRYESGPSNCLVESDEEPPRPLNEEALDVALTVALLLSARPVDEVEMMRKIVVDGSNTTGFQRTALIAVGGSLEVGGKRHEILSICLEEDAARKVGAAGHEVAYRLDRLGIPLVEIATGPTIASGAEAREVALEIGALLRATRRVRRGIGTIREDLNVSTEGGRRIEIKGVQELRLLGEYAEREEGRQKLLLRLRDELRRRGARVDARPVDVTAELTDLTEGPIGSAGQHGGSVLAVRLHGFAGLLGSQSGSDERLGRELADQARAAGLGGVVHSDEAPSHGLSEDRQARLRTRLSLAEGDAFVLVADRSPERARRAATAVAARAEAALEGVPGETRDPLPDGRSRYSRPLPGRDRLYPETDIPPVRIDAGRLTRLRARLPERPAATLARLAREHALAPELARQLVYGAELDRFDELVRRGHTPGGVARLLTQELPAVEVSASSVPFDPPLELLDELLGAAERGEFAKEGTPKVLAQLASGAPTVAEAVRRTGLVGADHDELARVVDRIVREQIDLVRERGEAAFSPLMGDVMRELRGRRDGREVAEELRRAIARHLSKAVG